MPRPTLSMHVTRDGDVSAVRSALAGVPMADTLRPWLFLRSSSG